MKKIFCIGEALIDMMCTDRNVSLKEGVNFIKKCGGAPTNVSIALKALGGDIQLAAVVGNDPFGDFIFQTLEDFNLDTTYIFKHNDKFTTIAYVSLQANGERDFYFQRGADGFVRIRDIQDINFSKFDIFHFGSATAFLEADLYYTYLYLFNLAVKENKFICFDPNYRDLLFGNHKEHFITQSLAFIEKAHFVKLSEAEALLIAQKNSLDESIAYFIKITKATFVITLGKEGSILVFGGRNYKIPSVEVQCIDSTGAGDAFVAAMLYQVQNLKSDIKHDLDLKLWLQFVENANKIAAKSCEYLGAIEAYKHLSFNL
ncbi:MAG: carbohydrate kinase [Alphaproteobacteria bacterium]|nr:carbohydrate kinase [Alphaproteobacteria bacterium]